MQQFPRSWWLVTGAQWWMMGLSITYLLPQKPLAANKACYLSWWQCGLSLPTTITFSFINAQVAWGKLCNRLLPWPGACTSHHLTEARVGGYLSSHFCTEKERSQLLPHTRSLENISSILPINYLEGDMLQLIA